MTDVTRRRRFPALDGLRGLAAIAVLLSHVGFLTGRSLQPDLLGPFLSRGNFGVTVFFLLSGFLLYRPFAQYSFGTNARPGLAQFFWRRAARIFPALWVMVALNLAFITPRHVPLSDWASYLLLVQTYNHHDYDTSLTQLWTLGVEVAFYALLPLLARLVGGPERGPDRVLVRHAVVLGAMAVTSAVFNLIVSHRIGIADDQAPLWLPDYLDWFAAGMLLAVLTSVPAGTRAFAHQRQVLHAWAASRGTCAVLAAILFALSMLPLGTPRTLAPATYWQLTMQHYLFLFAAFFIMLPLVLAPSRLGDGVLGSRAGSLLGNISYSIYLWHPVVMLWLQRRISHRIIGGPFVTMLALTLVITICIALLSWFLVERPVLRYTPRWLRKPATPAKAPEASAATHSN